MGVQMANIFISHRGADVAVAERLAEALRSSGHDVWLDIWKIKVGDSIISRINDGLSGASFLVLCCSDDTSTSSWMDVEWMSTLERQLEGEKIRILPVLLTGGAPPTIIRHIKYADLTSDWRRGMAELCKALG